MKNVKKKIRAPRDNFITADVLRDKCASETWQNIVEAYLFWMSERIKMVCLAVIRGINNEKS